MGGPKEEARDAGTVNSVVGGTILMGSRGQSGSLWEWGSERSPGAAAEGLRRGRTSGRADRRRRAPDRAASEEPRGALSGRGRGRAAAGFPGSGREAEQPRLTWPAGSRLLAGPDLSSRSLRPLGRCLGLPAPARRLSSVHDRPGVRRFSTSADPSPLPLPRKPPAAALEFRPH